MPFPNQQSVMPTHDGLAAGLDAYMRIANIQFTVNPINKAASYTLLPTDSGTFFIVSAAATFTLPAVATSAGLFWAFFNAANTNLTITAPSACMFCDGAASTTVTFSTSSHKIGGACFVWCDGTNYFCFCAGNLLAIPTLT